MATVDVVSRIGHIARHLDTSLVPESQNIFRASQNFQQSIVSAKTLFMALGSATRSRRARRYAPLSPVSHHLPTHGASLVQWLPFSIQSSAHHWNVQGPRPLPVSSSLVPSIHRRVVQAPPWHHLGPGHALHRVQNLPLHDRRHTTAPITFAGTNTSDTSCSFS